MQKITLIALLSLFTNLAFAKEKSMPFLGGQFGYTHQSVDGGKDRDGMDFGLRGVYSIQNENWYMDPGLGVQIEQLHGSRDVFTTSPFAELDLRYKLNENISFGPMTTLQLGGNQARNGEDDGSASLWLAGARLMLHRETTEGNPFRIEFNLQQSLSGDADSELYAFNVGIQFGFPWEEKKSYKPVTKTECHPCRKPQKQAALTPMNVEFGLDSSEISDFDNDRLGDLSRIIKLRDNEINLIRVEGHTDLRGNFNYNQTLSERRAEVVKEKLIKEGVNSTKIEAVGYGESRPLDPNMDETAFSKNRRTEIHFYRERNKDFAPRLKEAGSR